MNCSDGVGFFLILFRNIMAPFVTSSYLTMWLWLVFQYIITIVIYTWYVVIFVFYFASRCCGTLLRQHSIIAIYIAVHEPCFLENGFLSYRQNQNTVSFENSLLQFCKQQMFLISRCPIYCVYYDYNHWFIVPIS